MGKIEKAFEKDYPEDGEQYVGSMFDVYKKGFKASEKSNRANNKTMKLLIAELEAYAYGNAYCKETGKPWKHRIDHTLEILSKIPK